MGINAEGYFQCFESYLNTTYYGVTPNYVKKELNLKEKVFTQTGEEDIEIRLKFSGKAFAVKLDKQEKKNEHHPLFHFLDDQGQPWSRRCDFVIFHLLGKKINLYLFEYKYKSLKVEQIISQLTASEAWCKALCAVINIYTGKKKKVNLTKFVLSYCESPSDYLDAENKYLARDSSIRHYHYDEINGMDLKDLDNVTIESIG